MIRIAITGPESCGKTTLSEALALHYSADLVPEYARTYLGKIDRAYKLEDLDVIAEKHLEYMSLSQNSIQIVDTDFVVLSIWSKFKFDFVSPLISKLVQDTQFDLTILCAPDIPWKPDPLRENPNDREVLFKLYVEQLDALNRRYLIVENNHEERLKKSIKSIDSILI